MAKHAGFMYMLMAAALAGLFGACASNNAQPGVSPVPAVTAEPPASPAAKPTQPGTTATPVPAPTEMPEFIVSKEVFTQTFEEVQRLIEKLNDIIVRSDFAAWESYLSPAYKSHYSNPAVLKSQSDSPILRSRDIKLETLADFFRFVVVPSRAGVHLDDLRFLSESEVEAIMLVGKNRRVTVYRLIKINSQWMIGLASER